jgi:hypothetical protein
MFSAGLASIAVLLALYDVWFDTTPEILEGAPAYGSPFEAPFAVKNPSHIFLDDGSDHELQIGLCYCWKDDFFWGLDFRLPVKDASAGILKPGETKNFHCGLAEDSRRSQVSVANIHLVFEYKIFGHSFTTAAVPLTWDINAQPPRWIKGDIAT